MWHSLGDNKIKHCSETATLIPFRNTEWNNTLRVSLWRQTELLRWIDTGKKHWTRIWPELQLQWKDFRSAWVKSQGGCAENWLVLAACLEPQLCQHSGCGGITAPGVLPLWAALPWVSTDTLLSTGFLKKPDTNSFFFCFSQECCKDLVFPCSETCLAMQCPAEVWQKSLCWPNRRDEVSQSFPQEFERKLAWSRYKDLLLPFSKKIRGDSIAIRSFMCLFISCCPSVTSVFCATKGSPGSGTAVQLNNVCAMCIVRPLKFWVNNYLGAIAPNDTEEDYFCILLPVFPLLKPVYSQGYGTHRISVVLYSESLWDQFLLHWGCMRRGVCVCHKKVSQVMER